MQGIQSKLLVRGPQAHILFIAAMFCIQALGVYLLYVAGFRYDWRVAALDALLFLLCLYAGRSLCGRFYLHRHYQRFIVYSLLACFGITVLRWALVRYVAGHPFAGYLEVVRDTFPFYVLGLTAGFSIKLIRALLLKEIQDAQALASQKESEFQHLQAQLSPHFLFNVLNNLYGISIEEPGRMPGLMLKLSQLLRYSVYSGRNTYVPLTEELDYLRNYISFEQIRSSDRLLLDQHFDPVQDPFVKIAPLVLIVFVENAFKHARDTLDQRIFVGLSLHVRDAYIQFTVANSYRQEGHNTATLPSETGVGLANTLQRLRLLYGDDHRFRQWVENDRYFVELTIKIAHG